MQGYGLADVAVVIFSDAVVARLVSGKGADLSGELDGSKMYVVEYVWCEDTDSY